MLIIASIVYTNGENITGGLLAARVCVCVVTTIISIAPCKHDDDGVHARTHRHRQRGDRLPHNSHAYTFAAIIRFALGAAVLWIIFSNANNTRMTFDVDFEILVWLSSRSWLRLFV